MKCPYCGKDVIPKGYDCPECFAAIVKKEAIPIKSEPKRKIKGGN